MRPCNHKPAPHHTLILIKVPCFIETMAIADDIINELRKRPGLTAVEITLNLFGRRHPYAGSVRYYCRQLVDEGRLKRRGKGLQGKAFTYYLPRAS